MTVPTRQEFITEVLLGANTALANSIQQSGFSGCTIKIYSAADVLLATIPLQNPPSTLDSETGILTINIEGPAVASTGGNAAYAEICKSNGNWVTRMPCVQSTSAVRGRLALNTLTILAGAVVTVTALQVGA